MKNKIINLIFVSIMFFSIFKLFSWFNDKKESQNLNGNLKEISRVEENNGRGILINPPSNVNDSYWNYVDEEFLQIDFTNLLSKNNETVGWIRINGTNVDYPIVQTNDNKYYLNHSFDKSSNDAGWIYSDFRNNFNNLNSNTIIYGHNRIDDSMFGSLKYLLDANWYDDYANHIIKISTPNENTIWQIFSVYTILKETYYTTTYFMNDGAYQNFIDKIIKRSKYNFFTDININDKILTLSTCRDNYGNRIVVHAKLIKKEIRS